MYTNKIELDKGSADSAVAKIRHVCIHYGMPEDWFPQDERGQHRLVRVVEQWGTLPQNISSPASLALVHPDDKLVQRYPKEIRKKVTNDYPLLTNSFFVFTDGEEWWKQSQFIPHFLACEEWVRIVYDQVSQWLMTLFGDVESGQKV